MMKTNQAKTADEAKLSARESPKHRRFTVLWTVSGRERRSAQMTEVEAQRFVDRLTREKAEQVRVDETLTPTYVQFRVV
ncbi:MAG: hypothetical protein FJX60_12715 [Alphaproteobacteria bacterium]|nr:hypothetical protein [Alphaproteobacteria bacterium]